MNKNPGLSHSCQAAIVTCIDFRLQEYLSAFTAKIKGGFDRISIAGGVKDLPFIRQQLEISARLHHIKEVFLVNHEDCGAYAREGTFQKHKQDLVAAQKIIKQQFPKLKIYPLYLTLDGRFLKI